MFYFLFKSNCIVCYSSQTENVCGGCLAYLKRKKRQFCVVCGRSCDLGLTHRFCLKYSFLDGLYVSYESSFVLRKLVHEFKYKGRKDLAGLLASAMKFCDLLDDPSIDLSFVPIHFLKRMIRGYNQAELLAKCIGKPRDVLVRKKYSCSQTNFSLSERVKNVESVFAADKIEKARVLIVDDIVSSGATLNSCAKTLKNAGIKQVYALVLGRGLTKK